MEESEKNRRSAIPITRVELDSNRVAKIVSTDHTVDKLYQEYGRVFNEELTFTEYKSQFPGLLEGDILQALAYVSSLDV